MPGLQQHDIEAGADKTSIEPLGERPDLQTDPERSWLQVLEELHESLRLARHLSRFQRGGQRMLSVILSSGLVRDADHDRQISGCRECRAAA